MRKDVLVGLSSLLLPMGLYALPTAGGTYQRNYLRASASALQSPLHNAYSLSIKPPKQPSYNESKLDLIPGRTFRELIIIDAAIPDKQFFYRELKPGINVVELNGKQDGLKQLKTVLAQYQELEAVHIFSHAEGGKVQLGGSWLTADAIKNQVEFFSSLNKAIKDGGDLLFYGCNLAANKEGEAFLEIIAAGTHVDIAASNDFTGNAEHGGDWELEIHKGKIETQTPFSEKALRNFTALLVPTSYSALGFYNANPGTYFQQSSITSADGKMVLSNPSGLISVFSGGTYGNTFAYNVGSGNYLGQPVQLAADGANAGTFQLNTLILCNDTQSLGSGADLTTNLTVTGYYANNSTAGSTNLSVTTKGCGYGINVNDYDIFDVSSTFGASKQLARFRITYNGAAPSDRYFVFKAATVDNILAPDSTPPLFQNSTPSVSGITLTQTTLTVRLNEAGTAYYVVVPDGAGAPSAAQVKNGQNSGGGAAFKSGSVAISSAGSDFNTNITGLSSGTAYDIYVVAQDAIPNLQASPTKVDFSTLAPDADGNLTAAGGVSEPVGLDTTRDTVGEAADVFDFTLNDGGTADGVAMTISQLVVHVAGSTTDTERAQITWRLDGPDVSNVTGSYSAINDTITFSGLLISIANGGNETYILNAYYNNNTGISEDHTFVLSIDGDTDVTVGAGGTQMGATSLINNTAGGATLDVIATQLAFTTQPAGSISGNAFNTQPVVAAHDAFGNIDVDFTEIITLTEASAGTLSNNTQATTSGVATFTNVVYFATADQQSFTLTANDQDGVGSNLPTVNANAVTSDVVATKLRFSTQPAPTAVADGQATAFSTVPVVQATNALDIVDTGYATGITLSEVNGAGSATMTATGDTDGNAATVTITPGSGVSTFTGMQITYNNSAGNETFNLRASSGGLSTADSSNITAYAAPTVTDGNISISGASGTGGAYRIGDTVTATWNNTVGGDNNAGITGVTVNFSQFGGGAAVAATNSSNTWTATYTIVAGAINASNRNISVAANNAGNSTTTADTTNATVDNQTPTTSSVSVPANATYAGGQNLDFTVNYSEAITVNTGGGTPRLVLTIGATTRYASYISGSGTTALVFRHTVQSGDTDSNGIALNATLDTNGGTLSDDASNSASTTLNSIGNLASVLVDAQGPTVNSVSLPADATYSIGQNLDFTVNYNENVTVNTGGGTPRLALTIGATTRYANYLSGSGTSALVFRYTIQAGDSDNDGIALNTTLDANGGTLRDATGNDASSNLGAIGSLANVRVDALAPAVNSVTLPANAVYGSGQNLDFTVNYNENVAVNTGGGTPRLALTIGATTRYATYTSGSGSSALLFRYTVQAGDNDSDGIMLNATLETNGGTLRDSANNNASTNLGAIGSLANVNVDTTAPTVNAVSLPANATYGIGQNLDFTVNYNENITVNTGGGIPRLTLTIGAATRYATYTSGSGSSALLFRYTVQAGDNDSDGIALNTTLDTNGGTLRDSANNNADTNLGAIGSLVNVRVDTLTPIVTSVNLPVNGTYVTGEHLNFTVNYGENITVTGNPRLVLTIGSTTRYAVYLSGSGSSAIVFRYTVQNSDIDTNGIALSSTLDTNGGTLRNGASINASTNLGTIASLTGVLVNDDVDTDGDGVSDHQEGLDGTDPNDPDDYKDIIAPVVTAPDALVIDAVALHTPVTLRQLLGLASTATDAEVEAAVNDLATDNIDGDDCCNPNASILINNRVLLPPGRNNITWRATDRKGNTGQATQIVNIRPLVSLSRDQISAEGAQAQFHILLNGRAPFYPLQIPFVIDANGSADQNDHDLIDGIATFTAQQIKTSITVNLNDDGLPEGDETLIIRLDDRTTNIEDLANGYDVNNPDIYDINSGVKTRHILTLSEDNVAPDARLQLQQNSNNTILITATNGIVTATAQVTDPNNGDTHTFDWSQTDASLIDNDGIRDNATFVFNPSDLNSGRYRLQLTVRDSALAEDTAQLFFRVVDALPTLDSNNDSDGDGIDDQTEGSADTDNDGIPDYLDNIAALNVLPEDAAETNAYLLECDPGLLCRLGQYAILGASGGAWLNTNDIETQIDITVDQDFNYDNGVFDFEIHELPIAGASAHVVIPQLAAIPANAIYRKFQNGLWSNFVEDNNNSLHSAPGEPGYCPPPEDESWETGLIEGYYCVQLTLQDGGPNDADDSANRSIADPGGVATANSVTEPPARVRITSQVKGSGAIDFGLLLLLAALPLLRIPRVRKYLSTMLLLLFCIPQGRAQELSIELSFHQASGSHKAADLRNSLAAEGFDIDLERYDIDRGAQQLQLAYRYRQHTAVTLGYLDLGNIQVDLSTSAENNAALSSALARHYPISSAGWVIGHRFSYPLTERFNTGVTAGLYLWDGKIKASGLNVTADIPSGTDPILGLDLYYKLNQRYSAALHIQRVFFGGQYVTLWGSGLLINF